MVASDTRVSGGVGGSSTLARNWPENTKISWGRGLAWLERERRENMGLSLGCIFLTCLTTWVSFYLEK